jgi:hypothetical protein
VKDRSDIVCDILVLLALVVEGHLEKCQRLKDISDINLWTACDTYTKIWMAKVNKPLH